MEATLMQRVKDLALTVSKKTSMMNKDTTMDMVRQTRVIS